jgi:peptidoglycan hydrolase-like protein with peptidoglycan-binding domain
MARFEQTFPPFVPFGSRNLSGGEQGTDVAVLQTIYDQMLKVLNPPQGPLGQPITVTGTYDAATKQAVRNVQSYFGISVDGIAGPDTYFLFGQGVGPHVTYGGPRFGSRVLSQGMTGGDVTVLQNRLNLFRYSGILGAPADGVFGANTASAVTQFQLDAIANGDSGLATNGVVTAGTFDALWIYTYAGGRGIFTGRNGFDVAFLQLLLSKLGFYGGRITGFYDAATMAAVIALQTSAGIAVDGVVGQVTYFALGQRNLVAAPAPMPIPPIGPVTPQVSVCCVPLTSGTGDLHPYGEASHVINLAEGFESVGVAGFNLPDPSTFGAQFGQYAFRLTNPSTGAVTTGLMVELPATALSGDWAGSLSVGVKVIPVGPVVVVPTPAGSTTGPFGPAVLTGDLSPCPSPSASGSGDGGTPSAGD